METLGYKILEINVDRIFSSTKKYSGVKDNIKVDIAFSNGVVSLESSVLAFRLIVRILQDDKTIIESTTSSMVEFSETYWDQMIQDGKLILSKKIIKHMFSILYGTARGAILQKNKNNIMNNIFLPIIDYNEIFDEDAIFDLADPILSIE